MRLSPNLQAEHIAKPTFSSRLAEATSLFVLRRSSLTKADYD